MEVPSGCRHFADSLKDASQSSVFEDLAKAQARAKAAEKSSPTLLHHCTACSFSGDVTEIEAHHRALGHVISITQGTSIYCASCQETIYDKAIKSSPGKKRKLEDSDLQSNSIKRPCGREGVRGLFNLGHTCYMNALIQTMVHNSLLSSFFLGNGHPRHGCAKGGRDASCVACAFTDVFSESRVTTNTQPMAALSLLRASWLQIPEMQGEGQQDSHEWYLQIIDKLHECEKPSFDEKGVCRCFIHKAFFGLTRQEITCNKCGFESRTQEQMLHLALDLPSPITASTTNKKKAEAAASAEPDPTLIGCLGDLTAVESLTDDSYSCRGCQKTGKMTKSVRIRKLPAILCMQVKRFQNEFRGGSVVQRKIKRRIRFPLELDMRPFTTSAHRDGGDSRKFVYELESVIVHEGKAIEQGHYMAYCRGDAGGQRQWYRFNDARVTAVAEPMVLEQEAYLLFYSLKHLSGKGNSG